MSQAELETFNFAGLPREWFLTTLGEIADWGSGGTPSRSVPSFYEGNIPWIKTGDLGPRVINDVTEFISEEAVKNSSAKFFPKGSVDIAMYGATIGKTSILGIDATTNQACGVGNPIKGLTTTDFLYYVLRNEKDRFIARGKGGAQPNISQTLIKEHLIYLPPLAEQQQIAAKLDELLAQVDNLKTRLDNIPKILKRFRQSVLAAAVSGKLTYDWRSMNKVDHARILQETIKKSRTELLNQDDKESKRLKNKAESHSFQVSSEDKLPDSWIWTSFMDSMERVIDCHNKTAPYVESGIYLIRTPDIRNGIVSLENTRFVNESTYEYWSRRCPPRSGDILFTREAPMGEAGIIPTNTKLCMGQRIMLLRPMPEFTNPKYVLLNILSLPFKERMNKSAVGTAVKHLRVADVESLTYPLAPIEEQTEIVARVEQLFAYADQIEQRVKDAQSRVNHLTQAILAKAFRGELTADWRAQNPDLISGENSAEALLARIKAEREQTQVVKKAKATRSN